MFSSNFFLSMILCILKRENDSIALINYAEALKLYRDMDNKKAMGTILFNMGSIHLKNKRFQEAIISYKDSIESIGFLQKIIKKKSCSE